eukprot:2565359-Rhodomonas_salina.1
MGAFGWGENLQAMGIVEPRSVAVPSHRQAVINAVWALLEYLGVRTRSHPAHLSPRRHLSPRPVR